MCLSKCVWQCMCQCKASFMDIDFMYSINGFKHVCPAVHALSQDIWGLHSDVPSSQFTQHRLTVDFSRTNSKFHLLYTSTHDSYLHTPHKCAIISMCFTTSYQFNEQTYHKKMWYMFLGVIFCKGHERTSTVYDLRAWGGGIFLHINPRLIPDVSQQQNFCTCLCDFFFLKVRKRKMHASCKFIPSNSPITLRWPATSLEPKLLVTSQM